jgi:predicted secreted protein
MSRKWIRPVAMLALAMPMVVAVGACLAKPANDAQVALTEADSGAARTVTVGSGVEVRLSAQPGTGFAWSADTVDGLAVGAPAATGGQGIPGGAETQVFTVKVTTQGSHTLTFRYSRPWEGGEQNAKVVIYTITGS